jgi:hypothetical protein
MKLLNIFLLGAFFSLSVLPSAFACPCENSPSNEDFRKAVEQAPETPGN